VSSAPPKAEPETVDKTQSKSSPIVETLKVREEAIKPCKDLNEPSVKAQTEKEIHVEDANGKDKIGGIIEKMTIILIGGELYLQVDLLKQLLDDPRTRVIMGMMGLDIPRACLHAGLHTPKIATAFALVGCQ